MRTLGGRERPPLFLRAAVQRDLGPALADEPEEGITVRGHSGAAAGGQLGANGVDRGADRRREPPELVLLEGDRNLLVAVIDGLHGVDRRLHGENAARGERAALAEIGEDHRLADARGNLFLAAEDLGDGLAENVPRRVVGLPRVGRAGEGVDRVARPGRDGPAGKRVGGGVVGAGDRVPVVRALREGDERLVLGIVELDGHILVKRLSG